MIKKLKELENLLSQEERGEHCLRRGEQKSCWQNQSAYGSTEKHEKENLQQKAQLNSFVKSFSSLQDDREPHSQWLPTAGRATSLCDLGKDQLIQDAATENNKLKGRKSEAWEVIWMTLILRMPSSMQSWSSIEKTWTKCCQRKTVSKSSSATQHFSSSKSPEGEYAKLEAKLKRSLRKQGEELQRSSLALKKE